MTDAGKIAFEEAWAPDDLAQKAHPFTANNMGDELPMRLADVTGRRLAEMDRLGVERAVLSLTSAGPSRTCPPPWRVACTVMAASGGDSWGLAGSWKGLTS